MINKKFFNQKVLYTVAFCAIALMIWEWYAQFVNAGFMLSSPSAIIRAIIENAGLFLENGLPTVATALVGLALGLVIAFITASAITLSRPVDAVLTPLVLASQTLPIVAIGPILVAVLGSGVFSQIAITAWLCWFPAVIAFIYGLSNVPPERLNLFRISQATKWQTFIKLRLPGAAKYFVSGLRAAAGFALIGAIVMEYGGAQKGLGVMAIKHSIGVSVLPNDVLMALVVLCSVLGAAITWLSYRAGKVALRKYLVD